VTGQRPLTGRGDVDAGRDAWPSTREASHDVQADQCRSWTPGGFPFSLGSEEGSTLSISGMPALDADGNLLPGPCSST